MVCLSEPRRLWLERLLSPCLSPAGCSTFSSGRLGLGAEGLTLLGLGLSSTFGLFSFGVMFAAGAAGGGAGLTGEAVVVVAEGEVGSGRCGSVLLGLVVVESRRNLLGLSSPQDSRASSLSSSASRSSRRMLYCMAWLGAVTGAGAGESERAGAEATNGVEVGAEGAAEAGAETEVGLGADGGVVGLLLKLM